MNANGKYFVIVYGNDYHEDKIVPIPFETYEKAENYIIKNNLHAYIALRLEKRK